MALERKDVRFKLDPNDHERLAVVVSHDNQDIGEWVEQLVLREIESRHVASVTARSLADALDRLGISGQSRELSFRGPK